MKTIDRQLLSPLHDEAIAIFQEYNGRNFNAWLDIPTRLLTLYPVGDLDQVYQLRRAAAIDRGDVRLVRWDD